MDNLVSVIVPIHNTGKYLKKCLNSIVNQTYKNLEILLINDGSTDNSAKIIDQFAKKDTRIKVFTNETAQGVSNARNLGLDNASGEYINFVDGDDWILKDAINSLVKTLENNDSDLSQGNIKCVISPLKISNNNVIKNWIVGNNKNLVQCFIHIESGSCDNKIFKKAIINSYNLRFKSINIFEDSNFLLSYLNHSKKVSTINKVTYFYNRLNVSGLSRRKQNKSIIDTSLMVVEDYIKIFKEDLNELKTAYGFYNFISGVSNETLKRIVLMQGSKQEILDIIQKFKLDMLELLNKYDLTDNVTENCIHIYDLKNMSIDQLYNKIIFVYYGKKTKIRNLIKKIFNPIAKFFIFKLNWFYND